MPTDAIPPFEAPIDSVLSVFAVDCSLSNPVVAFDSVLIPSSVFFVCG